MRSPKFFPTATASCARVFALLRGATKVDFGRYKPTTIRRRIGRRMMVSHTETLSDYSRYIEQHPAELRELYRDLLISVTSFFRDPQSFEALGKLLTESIGTRNTDEEPIRVWVPGCATGEEVYSLAILLFEILQELKLPTSLQLFGTDISDLALDRARHGLYPPTIEEDVSPERLRRFFSKIDSGYQISKMIREGCVFARHDVIFDPPFSSLDLVSCRNLLIYLDQNAQHNVLPIFHYALKSTGLLFLGSAETTAAAPELFTTVDQQNKIYGPKPITPRLPLGLSLRGGAQFEPFPSTSSPGTSNAAELQKRLERVIQSRYSPDGVLINAEFQIIQFRGHTSLFLDPSPGQAGLNVLRMVRENLVLPLRRAVLGATETNGPVRETGLEFEVAGERQTISIEVTPIPGAEPGERYFLVVFTREKPGSEPLPDHSSLEVVSEDDRVSVLERELGETRAYLRNMTEQYEAHSEELRAANEEARSANEELQSTNEELRTTKEELQSTNEELTTVNEELQSRNVEVNATNSDLRNLLSSVTIPILMLDSDLRVRRFNSAAGALLELSSVDIGRPVGHLKGRFEVPRLENQVKTVIETLNPHFEELQDSAGCWYQLNVRPYRTVDDRIMGAVITLQDIDPLKRGLQAAEEARDYAEGMIETVREPLVVLDSDLRVQRATQAFYDMFMVSREETQGRFLYDLGNGQWNQPRLRELIGNALFRSQPFYDFEIDHEFPHIGRRAARLNGRRIPFPQAERKMLLLSIEDVTERREIAEIRFQRLFETAKDGIVVVDMESQSVQDVNPHVLRLTEYGREDFVGRKLAEVGEMLGLDGVEEAFQAIRETGVVRNEDVEVKNRNGESLRVDVLGNSYQVGTQPVIQFNVRDVGDRYKALKALQESEQRLRLFVESVGDFALFQLDPAGTIVTWNLGADRLLGWKEQEAVGQPASLVFTPEDVAAKEHEKEIETARTRGRAEDERWHIRKDGSRFFASGVLTQVCDEQQRLVGFAKVMRDVTLRMQQEEQLRRTVSEKETLVREIHHRVKNNLQVIVSLLSMQSRYTSEPEVLAAFGEAESRLRAIAHIHERLYASEDLTEIEFAGYVTGLAKELIQLHSTNPHQIELELEVSELTLHVERAIPLGLIANELMMNSIKYGLSAGAGGKRKLTVRLGGLPRDPAPEGSDASRVRWAELHIEDTGPGLPAGLDPAKAKSMGLRLVSMLVHQLHGRLDIRPGPGAAVSVAFPIQMDIRVPGEEAEDEPAGSHRRG